jgi:hypothetical protein
MNECELLLKIAKEKVMPTKWDNATFEIIKKADTSTKGEIGELFIEQLCHTQIDANAKRNVNKRDSFDITICGKAVEIKVAIGRYCGKLSV